MLLYTIGAAFIFTNLLLFFIYFLGCDGLLFTWVPLQTAIITVTFLLNTELAKQTLLNTLYFNFGSHLIPVIFLIVFVVGMSSKKLNDYPNFRSIWIVAILVLTIALSILYFFQNTILLLICGILSIFLNFFNIQTITFDDNDNIKVTWIYVIACNIFTVICVYGLNLLVLNNYEKFAAVISSVPLISVMVLAQSTYIDPVKEITLRHILMLAAQIWPSTCYVGITIVCLEMEWVNTIVIPSLCSIMIVMVQYVLFNKKKHSALRSRVVNNVKYNFVQRENLQF